MAGAGAGAGAGLRELPEEHRACRRRTLDAPAIDSHQADAAWGCRASACGGRSRRQ